MKRLSKYVYEVEYEHHMSYTQLIAHEKYFIYDEDTLTVKHLEKGIIPRGVPDSVNSSSSCHLKYSFSFNYDEYFKNGYCVFTNHTKYGLIDDNGNVILLPRYEAICRFKNGLAIVQGEHIQFGVIDSNGFVVIPIKYDKIQRVENDNYSFVAYTDYEIDYLNDQGNVVNRVHLPIVIEQNGQYGIVSGRTGACIIPTQFDFVKRIENPGCKGGTKAFIVKKGGKYGILNALGEWVHECIFDRIKIDSGSFSKTISFRIGDRTGVLDSALDLIYENRYGNYEILKEAEQMQLRRFSNKEITFKTSDGESISFLCGELFLLTKIDDCSNEAVYCVINGDGRKITPSYGKKLLYNNAGYFVFYRLTCKVPCLSYPKIL